LIAVAHHMNLHADDGGGHRGDQAMTQTKRRG
jgi:hypothetical protein